MNLQQPLSTSASYIKLKLNDLPVSETAIIQQAHYIRTGCSLQPEGRALFVETLNKLNTQHY